MLISLGRLYDIFWTLRFRNIILIASEYYQIMLQSTRPIHKSAQENFKALQQFNDVFFTFFFYKYKIFCALNISKKKIEANRGYKFTRKNICPWSYF